MKVRIIGGLIVLAILSVLYVLTEGIMSTTISAAVPGQAQTSDSDFKSLKIQ